MPWVASTVRGELLSLGRARDAYKGCFGDASAHHLDVISPQAEAAESSSKADYTAAAHILCKLSASDLAQKEETLQRCESTGHLNLSYPELVTEDPCLVPQASHDRCPPRGGRGLADLVHESWLGSPVLVESQFQLLSIRLMFI